MKPGFSFNDAVGAPFALLKRRPLTLFVWGLMWAAMTVAIYSVMLPLLASIPFGDAHDAEAVNAYMQETSRFSASINGMNLIMYLIMLLTWTAAGRATLSPGRGDRFLFLRLGMDEVRVAVTVVGVFIAWYIALIVMVLIGAGIGMALWSQGQATAIAVLIVYGLLVFALSIWGWLRVSLMAPASLILKRFAFAEGWAIARGQMWKLLGMNLVIWVIYIISAILMYAVAIAILAGGFFGQGLAWPQDIESITDLEPVLKPMLLPLALTVIPFSLGFGWIMSLYAAPSVIAARQLLDGVPAAPAPAPTSANTEDAPPVDTLQPL